MERELAELAVRLLEERATPADPVIRLAEPEELVTRFAETVGLGLGRPEPVNDPADVLAAIELVIEHSVRTDHPRFLNQNFAGADPVAIVGDWLGSALNTTAATFEAAPVFTLMENAVLTRLADLAGYVPADAGDDLTVIPPGLFCPGGSTATLYALQLARHRHDPSIVRSGAGSERLVLFVSDSGHYSAVKSAALLGLGMEAVIKVRTDEVGAMVPDALEHEITEATSRGERPFAVIGTAGTTVTAAFDDLNALADICERHRLWFHVDGCYGGSALFSPAEAHRLNGVERSDSFVWNLHKMLGMTQQCTALLIREPELLTSCFATGADYLFQPDKLHPDLDAGDRTFQCARRVDVLKLWLAWKVRGDEGFGARIDHAVALAAHATQVIEASGGAFVPVAPPSFTNVVFVWVPPTLWPLPAPVPALDLATRDTLDRLPPLIKARMQSEGTAMVGFQPVHGVNAFRLLFMNPAVTTTDVDMVLGLIAAYGEDAAQV